MLVTCPVCNGSKVSPFRPHAPCLCCDGAGTVTAEKDAALARIRRDVTARLVHLAFREPEAFHGLSSSLQDPVKTPPGRK